MSERWGLMSYKQLRHGGVLVVYSLIKKMGGQGGAEDQTT